jgi:predicted metal-dependent hydrolase
MSYSYTRRVGRSLARLAISIRPPDRIFVSAHPLVPEFIVKQFVESKSEWISQQLVKISSHTSTSSAMPDTIAIFGKPHQLVLSQDTNKPVGFQLHDGKLIWNHWQASKQTKTQLDTNLRKFLIAKAKQFLSLRTAYWAEKMQLRPTRLSYKEQTSRWGSCSSSKSLSFNWRLIHVPPVVADYVVIHELAHIKELNHSAAFWELVAKFDPAHRVHRGWLKRHGHEWETSWHVMMAK